MIIGNYLPLIPYIYIFKQTEYENDTKTYSVQNYLDSAMQSSLLTDAQIAQVKETNTYCTYAVNWFNGTAILTDDSINAIPDVSAEDLSIRHKRRRADYSRRCFVRAFILRRPCG